MSSKQHFLILLSNAIKNASETCFLLFFIIKVFQLTTLFLTSDPGLYSMQLHHAVNAFL